MSISPAPSETALVVDDDDLGRAFATMLLEEAGYEVLEASGAAAAIERLEARPDVRVMVTDFQMPGRDGLDLAKEVHRRWPHVALVVASGGYHIDEDHIPDEGLFLPKPFTAEQLRARLDEAKRRHEN